MGSYVEDNDTLNTWYFYFYCCIFTVLVAFGIFFLHRCIVRVLVVPSTLLLQIAESFLFKDSNSVVEPHGGQQLFAGKDVHK